MFDGARGLVCREDVWETYKDAARKFLNDTKTLEDELRQKLTNISIAKDAVASRVRFLGTNNGVIEEV